MDGIKILYEDKYLLLCEKPAGVPSQPDLSGLPDVLTVLSEKYRDIKLVHRLDIPTGGVMVYAKNAPCAGKLSALVQNHDPDGDNGMAKTYLAVLSREPDFEQGELSDLLFHDKQKNKSHQVRVQFASRGCPLCGDGKYGSGEKCPFIALWSHSLSFVHPFTKKKIKAVSTPHGISPWNLFDI